MGPDPAGVSAKRVRTSAKKGLGLITTTGVAQQCGHKPERVAQVLRVRCGSSSGEFFVKAGCFACRLQGFIRPLYGIYADSQGKLRDSKVAPSRLILPKA